MSRKVSYYTSGKFAFAFLKPRQENRWWRVNPKRRSRATSRPQKGPTLINEFRPSHLPHTATMLLHRDATLTVVDFSVGLSQYHCCIQLSLRRPPFGRLGPCNLHRKPVVRLCMLQHHLVWWIVVGLVSGALAKALMPGTRDKPQGCLMTMALGIAGSVIVGYVMRYVLHDQGNGGWI